MKFLLKILLLASLPCAYSQEKTEDVYSAYFTEKSLSELTSASGVDKTYHRKYELKESEKNQVRRASGEVLVVDETGIYLEKNTLLFITREQVREDSKYSVRDGYLFGVVDNDSVLTALDGERYYFLVPRKTYLFDKKAAGTKLFSGKLAGEYLLVTREPNGYYSSIYLRFSGNALTIADLVLHTEGCSWKNVANVETQKGDFNTYIMSPTSAEWKKLFDCFVIYDEFVPIKS